MFKNLIHRIKWWIKYRNANPKDIRLHPILKKQIEYKHTIEGIHYYQLVNDYDIPQDRFKFLRTYYQQLELKFTSDTLNKFMEAMIAECNKGNLIKVAEIAKEVKYRSTWLFEPESLFNLYSVITFDLQEDITDYDIEYNKPKIASFKKKVEIFQGILQQLVGDAQTLLDLSQEDSEQYMLKLEDNIKRQLKLTSQDSPSKPN